MRCALATLGSRGDVEPFILLAGALAERGHAVTLALDEGHHALPSLARLRERFPIRLETLGRLAAAEMIGTVERAVAAPTPIERSRAGYAGFIGHRRAALRARIAEIVAGHDVVVASEVLAFVENGRLPWTVPTAFVWYTLAPDVDFARPAGVDCLRLLALPSFVAVRDPTLATMLVFTGFWLGEPGPPLAADVEHFLAAGPPPVMLTMGSMSGFDAGALVAAFVAAARGAARRVIIQQGWAGLVAPPGDDVLGVAEVDYARLFPRCAAVFVHGGTGTIAHALRAGTPIGLLPLVEDQQGWARILQGAGASLGTLDPRQPDLIAFAAAFARIDDPDLARATARLAAEVSGERGLAAACDAIHAFASGSAS